MPNDISQPIFSIFRLQPLVSKRNPTTFLVGWKTNSNPTDPGKCWRILRHIRRDHWGSSSSRTWLYGIRRAAHCPAATIKDMGI